MAQSALGSLLAALVAGVCAVGVLSGCDVTIRDGDITNVSVRAKATREWTRHYSLADGGRVEIVNPHGSIEVAVGPEGTVNVEAAIESRAMTDERAKEALEGAKIEEQATQDYVRVATARLGGSLRTYYKVTVPANARVELTANNGRVRVGGMAGHIKVMVVNGEIELTDVRGTVDAASVNGPVAVKMAEVTGRVRVESTNGRISIQVPKTAKATLNARSVNGGITVAGLTVDEGTGRRIRTLESPLNGGGPEIGLRVTNGGISITGVESPKSPESKVQSPEKVESPESR